MENEDSSGITHLATLAIRCPQCGSTKLVKEVAADAGNQAKCLDCGNNFDLDVAAREIGNAGADAVREALIKALKK